MRFLVDQNALFLVEGLRQAGHDIIGVAEYDMKRAEDQEILDRATQEDRIIITKDVGDFGRHLAARQVSKPSVLLIRFPLADWKPETQLDALLETLGREEVQAALEAGAFVVIEAAGQFRIRPLPLVKP